MDTENTTPTPEPTTDSPAGTRVLDDGWTETITASERRLTSPCGKTTLVYSNFTK